MSNSMKIRPVRAELFHVDRKTDRQTDMTKLIVAFRKSANSPRNANTFRKVLPSCYWFQFRW